MAKTRPVTRDDVAQTASALKNLDGYIAQQIAAESRSEQERILMQGMVQSNPDVQAKLRSHYATELTYRLRDQTTQLQQQVNADLASAADAHDRAQTAWQNAIKRDEYAFQQSRLSARIKEARTPNDLATLVQQAQSREQLEALRDLLPDAVGRFPELMERAKVDSLKSDVARRIDALRPSTLVDSANKLQSTIDVAQAVDATLQQANRDANGVLDVALGLSLFSPSPDGGVQWQPQSYQTEGAGLLG